MRMPEYSLIELAKLADVTPRTIRFYIEQGLLAAPASFGPKAKYTDEHLARLLQIKKLQAAHQPLAEIRQQLRAGQPIEPASAAAAAPAPAPSAAIDYIRGVLGRPAAAPAPSTPAPSPAPAPPAPAASQPTTQSEPAGRSQWERIELDPDVELHIRRPMTRQNNKRVERLINIARQLFEED
jgi:DNA-binding transcriptional MerR regulator